MSRGNSAVVLQQFKRSPKQSVGICAGENGISRTSVYRILKTFKWKFYVPRLLHAMVEDDPDCRIEFCESVDLIVWSDEATFKLNGAVNRHNCTYWSSENPNVHVGKAVNLPGLTV
jgi:hypothetical protein